MSVGRLADTRSTTGRIASVLVTKLLLGCGATATTALDSAVTVTWTSTTSPTISRSWTTAIWTCTFGSRSCMIPSAHKTSHGATNSATSGIPTNTAITAPARLSSTDTISRSVAERLIQWLKVGVLQWAVLLVWELTPGSRARLRMLRHRAPTAQDEGRSDGPTREWQWLSHRRE